MNADPFQFFHVPTISLHVPSWAVMGCGLLVLLALLLAGSVAIAGRKTHVTGLHVLSFFQMLLWVVPAIVVVVLVGRSTSTAPPASTEDPAPAVAARDPNLIRPRTTSSEVPTWARPPEGEKKGLASRLASAVRRIRGQSQVDSFAFTSDPFVTEAEASKSLTPKVVETLKEQLLTGFPIPGDFTIPGALVDQFGVKEAVLQPTEFDFGLGKPETMFVLHVRAEVTPELRSEVHKSWQGQVVVGRLTKYGAGVGLVTALAAVLAGYLGLNQITQRRYVWRLRLAALSGLAATGLVASQLLM